MTEPTQVKLPILGHHIYDDQNRNLIGKHFYISERVAHYLIRSSPWLGNSPDPTDLGDKAFVLVDAEDAVLIVYRSIPYWELFCIPAWLFVHWLSDQILYQRYTSGIAHTYTCLAALPVWNDQIRSELSRILRPGEIKTRIDELLATTRD